MTAGGWMLMAVFWVAVIAFIVWAVVGLSRGRSDGGAHRETPEEILDRRFASGELDAEEYRERREELRGRGGAPR